MSTPVYKDILEKIYKNYYGKPVPADLETVCWEVNEIIKAANDESVGRELRSTQVIASIVELYERIGIAE